jgi:hypothetical protein
MHKIEQANFTREIKRNVQLREILIFKDIEDQAAVIKVHKAEHIAGQYYEELLRNTLEVVIRQLRI